MTQKVILRVHPVHLMNVEQRQAAADNQSPSQQTSKYSYKRLNHQRINEHFISLSPTVV